MSATASLAAADPRPSGADPREERPTCLLVKPAASRDASGGDTIVYRRWAEYVSARMRMETLELPPLGRANQLWNVARGAPSEVARYEGAENRARLRAALAGRRFDVVFFAHESTFPLSDDPALADARKVLFTQNLHTLIAQTDHSWAARLMRAGAARFERRWYGDPSARLICISEVDRAGLSGLGVDRSDVPVIPPGAPREAPLPPGAGLRPEAVITGSYGWWRKRRDLKRFAAERPVMPVPILASDPAAVAILARSETAVSAREIDWSAGVRFGIVTDRFLGGFKLKAVEYVACNCLVLSLCDISAEFAGLPHAEEFVRCFSSKREIVDLISAWMSSADAGAIERFRTFKAACLERYDWDRCLAPLAEVLLT